MNKERLKGILTNIQPSHTINDIEFNKATLIVPRCTESCEDVLNIRFKKYSNPYEENSEVCLSGNLRSYSSRIDNGKNKVELYVFTYFDQPDLDEKDQECINRVDIDGRICKVDKIRKTKTGYSNLHFILANNLLVSDGTKKLNSYIPCIAWDTLADELATVTVNTPIQLKGELHSREYKKTLPDGSIELRVAHEVVVKEYHLLRHLTTWRELLLKVR